MRVVSEEARACPAKITPGQGSVTEFCSWSLMRPCRHSSKHPLSRADPGALGLQVSACLAESWVHSSPVLSCDDNECAPPPPHADNVCRKRPVIGYKKDRVLGAWNVVQLVECLL